MSSIGRSIPLNTSLSDPVATMLGFKQYLHGTAYKAGITPTLSFSQQNATLVVARAVLVPYQMQDGSWRLRFNYATMNTSAASISGGTFNILTTGILYKVTTNYVQAVNATTDGGTNVIRFSYALQNSNLITLNFSPSNNFNQTGYYVSGDVELESQPTWAY